MFSNVLLSSVDGQDQIGTGKLANRVKRFQVTAITINFYLINGFIAIQFISRSIDNHYGFRLPEKIFSDDMGQKIALTCFIGSTTDSSTTMVYVVVKASPEDNPDDDQGIISSTSSYPNYFGSKGTLNKKASMAYPWVWILLIIGQVFSYLGVSCMKCILNFWHSDNKITSEKIDKMVKDYMNSNEKDEVKMIRKHFLTDQNLTKDDWNKLANNSLYAVTSISVALIILLSSYYAILLYFFTNGYTLWDVNIIFASKLVCRTEVDSKTMIFAKSDSQYPGLTQMIEIEMVRVYSEYHKVFAIIYTVYIALIVFGLILERMKFFICEYIPASTTKDQRALEEFFRFGVNIFGVRRKIVEVILGLKTQEVQQPVPTTTAAPTTTTAGQ